MTDKTSLRAVAVGNHEDGYRGVIEVGFHSELIAFECGHTHPKTTEARDCARKMVWRLLDEADGITDDTLAALLHDNAIGCEQHAPYRVGSMANVSVHRVHAARLTAAGVRVAPSPDVPGLRKAALRALDAWDALNSEHATQNDDGLLAAAMESIRAALGPGAPKETA